MSAPNAIVALHIAEDGSYDLKVWGGSEVRVLWVDERSPGDRVYEQTSREPDGATLRELIGENPIGHAGDGHLDEQTIQAIRAMAWRMDGGKLGEVEPKANGQGRKGGGECSGMTKENVDE